MKKTILGFLMLGLIITSSCHKSTSNPGGSWTLKGTTYNTTACVNSGSSLAASDISGSTVAGLTVIFYGTVPTTSGTYTVNRTPASAGQIEVSVGLNGSGYISTGSNGLQTVSVTVSNGKVSISGTGITVANSQAGLASDSTNVTFNITQTQ